MRSDRLESSLLFVGLLGEHFIGRNTGSRKAFSQLAAVSEEEQAYLLVQVVESCEPPAARFTQQVHPVWEQQLKTFNSTPTDWVYY